MQEFLEVVIEGFAKGTARHHHLVFKAHPLENGRSPLRKIIRDWRANTGSRTACIMCAAANWRSFWIMRAGRDRQFHRRSAGAVARHSAQGLRRRGLRKPEFVSEQTLPDFFTSPTRPDSKAYKDYRRYLLETSQVPGGFYSARGRRQLMRQVVDMMLGDEDPYDALKSGKVPQRQPLRIVT